jgi:nitric oxide dioxygenase
VTFRVRRVDDRLVKTSLPGQYVSVRVRMPDGVRQPRQYSLTAADDGEHRQFSVKRVRGDGGPDGEVSTHLCDTVRVGDPLTLSLPFGDVVLDDSRPAVFASAGIGIAPMTGMLSHLRHAGSGCRSPCCTPTPTSRPSPCAARCSTTSARCPTRTCTSGTSPAPAASSRWTACTPARWTSVRWTCPTVPRSTCAGPLPFMQAVRSALIDRGVAARDVQYEVFGPDLWQADLRTEPAPGSGADG